MASAQEDVAQPVLIVNAEALILERYGGKRILLVDDEPVNLVVARMLLEDAGLLVDTAEDGAAGRDTGSRIKFCRDPDGHADAQS